MSVILVASTFLATTQILYEFISFHQPIDIMKTTMC